MKTQKLSQSLKDENRMTQQQLQEKGLLKYGQMSNKLAESANNLATQQQRDKLKNIIQNREDLETLHKQNIITPNVAPQLAAKHRELDKQQKSDAIRQKLEHKERPNKKELEQRDILYSENMASSLQANAKDLEHKLRKHDYDKNQEENGYTSSPEIDQSPTQTDIELEEQDQFDSVSGINTQSMQQTLEHRTQQKMEKRLSKPIGLNSTQRRR